MTRRSSFGSFVRAVTSPAAGARAAAPPLDPACTHLFQRGRCFHCKGRSAFARGRERGTGAPRIRTCRPEKDEQELGIRLLCLIGCRYDKTGVSTDIWVYGSRRPRHLPKAAHSTFTTPGTPDVRAHLPLVAKHAPPASATPKEVWWEVKADDGSPSDAQLNFEAGCQARGIAHVMGGYEQLRVFLVRHGFIRQ